MKAGFVLGAMPALIVAGALLLPMSVATALNVTVDGNINEWVQNASSIYSAANPGNAAFTAVSGVSSWIEDGPCTGSYGYVGPGYGGQDYDLEAMYAYADTTGLYVAIVTGADPDGDRSWGGAAPLMRPGDVFFDFGTNGSWDLAIETNSLSTAYQPEANSNASLVGHGFGATTGTWWTNPYYADYTASAPSEIIHANAPAGRVVATDLGAVGAFAYSDMSSTDLEYASGNPSDWRAGDHNVIEMYLSSTWLAANEFNLAGPIDVRVHWTEQCGNDVGITPAVTVPKVPEPVSMVILGCLGAGMLGARKFMQWGKTAK